jgi:hypothetical protein
MNLSNLAAGPYRPAMGAGAGIRTDACRSPGGHKKTRPPYIGREIAFWGKNRPKIRFGRFAMSRNFRLRSNLWPQNIFCELYTLGSPYISILGTHPTYLVNAVDKPLDMVMLRACRDQREQWWPVVRIT